MLTHHYRFVQWSISHVEDGAYRLASHRGSSDVPLSTGNGNELVCVPDGSSTTWTIEPRGNAYVSAFIPYCPYDSLIHQDRIGNAVNTIIAIHLTQRPHYVSQSMFDVMSSPLKLFPNMHRSWL